jgi:hypothetical protein
MTKQFPSKRGGAREGAGRPTKAESEKKITLAICLSADARAWLLTQPGSLSATVERLIRQAMNQTPLPETIMNAYIINNHGEPVATATTNTKGSIRYGFVTVREEIDANRELNLVNARPGKISTAKKWADWERTHEPLPSAKEINPGQFLIN